MYEYLPNDDTFITKNTVEKIQMLVINNELEKLINLSIKYIEKCVVYFAIKYKKDEIFDEFYNADISDKSVYSHHDSFLSLANEHTNEYALCIILKCNSCEQTRFSEWYIKHELNLLSYHTTYYNDRDETIIENLLDYLINVLNSKVCEEDLAKHLCEYSDTIYSIQKDKLNILKEEQIKQANIIRPLCNRIETNLFGPIGPSIFKFILNEEDWVEV